MKIPYGTADFATLRHENFFYVDKTMFLPILERAESGYRYLVFLRPRRFGKSTLVSMLAHYYDINRKDQFDALFGGLWIHEHPTPERNSYLILSFDFSQVVTSRGEDALFRTFFEAVLISVKRFVSAYREHVPELRHLEERLPTFEDPEALSTALLGLISSTSHKIYLLIDEYDHFANRLLAGGASDTYKSVINDGFVRTFYATLKAGAGLGTVARMFITGVTPLMLDDLSSGFNISSNASMDPALNTLAGFTRSDVHRALDEFLAARPTIAQLPELGDRNRLLDTLEQHYDGYRFSERAAERVFNSDMVLYFLAEVDKQQRYPTDMLDMNVRTDYGHLLRIGALGDTVEQGKRRTLLETVLSDGSIRGDLLRQFGVRSLQSRTTYLSLLYYMGMLTLGEAPRSSLGFQLEVPNRVIRELQWEHLALMLDDQTQIKIDLDSLLDALEAMAVGGDIRPFLEVFHSQVVKKLGIKDTRQLGEKTLKLLFMTYVSLGKAFHPLSEKEFNQGYCDLFLGTARNLPKSRYSWLIEFKYLPANAKPPQVENAFADAEAQVIRYAADQTLLPLLLGGERELKAGMIVFVGLKKVEFRPWPPEPKATKKAAAKKRAARG